MHSKISDLLHRNIYWIAQFLQLQRNSCYRESMFCRPLLEGGICCQFVWNMLKTNFILSSLELRLNNTSNSTPSYVINAITWKENRFKAIVS